MNIKLLLTIGVMYCESKGFQPARASAALNTFARSALEKTRPAQAKISNKWKSFSSKYPKGSVASIYVAAACVTAFAIRHSMNTTTAIPSVSHSTATGAGSSARNVHQSASNTTADAKIASHTDTAERLNLELNTLQNLYSTLQTEHNAMKITLEAAVANLTTAKHEESIAYKQIKHEEHMAWLDIIMAWNEITESFALTQALQTQQEIYYDQITQEEALAWLKIYFNQITHFNQITQKEALAWLNIKCDHILTKEKINDLYKQILAKQALQSQQEASYEQIKNEEALAWNNMTHAFKNQSLNEANLSKIDALNKQIRKSRTLLSQYSPHGTTVAADTDFNAELSAVLSDYQEQLQDSKHTSNALEVQLVRSRSESVVMQEALAEARSASTALEAEVAATQEKLSEAEKKITALQEKINSLEFQISILKTNIDQNAEQIRISESTISDLMERLASTTADLANKQKDLDAAKVSLSAATTEQHNRYLRLNKKIDTLEKALKTLQDTQAKDQTALAEQQAILEQARLIHTEQQTALYKAFDELEATQRNATVDLEQSEFANISRLSEIYTMQNINIAKLNTEFAKSHEAFNNIIQQNREIQKTATERNTKALETLEQTGKNLASNASEHLIASMSNINQIDYNQLVATFSELLNNMNQANDKMAGELNANKNRAEESISDASSDIKAMYSLSKHIIEIGTHVNTCMHAVCSRLSDSNTVLTEENMHHQEALIASQDDKEALQARYTSQLQAIENAIKKIIEECETKVTNHTNSLNQTSIFSSGERQNAINTGNIQAYSAIVSKLKTFARAAIFAKTANTSALSRDHSVTNRSRSNSIMSINSQSKSSSQSELVGDILPTTAPIAAATLEPVTAVATAVVSEQSGVITATDTALYSSPRRGLGVRSNANTPTPAKSPIQTTHLSHNIQAISSQEN